MVYRALFGWYGIIEFNVPLDTSIGHFGDGALFGSSYIKRVNHFSFCLTMYTVQADKGASRGQMHESDENDRTGRAEIKTGLRGGLPQGLSNVVYTE